jgi:hypothetical protein
MAPSYLVLRPIKVLAALAVIIGLLAASVGVVGGLSMAGAIIQGDARGDAFRLAFIVIPLVAACLFVFGAARERVRPSAATAIYCGAVVLIAGQLVLTTLQ